MRAHLLLTLASLIFCSVAQAQTPAAGEHAPRDFNSLVGHWQCSAKQMHIGFEQFELEYMDASLALVIDREVQSSNFTTRMQATSLTHEPMFDASSLITFDARRQGYVQYEHTQDGPEATLYTPGFVGACVTWQYAPDAATADAASEDDFSVQARFCLDDETGELNIDYTLRFLNHDPLVLLMAQCQTQSDAP